MDYPEEWKELPRHERRMKIRELERQRRKKSTSFKKIRNILLTVIIIFILATVFIFLTKKSPEQIEFEQQVASVSLKGKVEKIAIEGRDHVLPGSTVLYKTNPPTSGNHLGQAENWGVYDKEIDDKAAVHGLEHGGIWISYKNIDEEAVKILKRIGKNNSQSVIVSPRLANDDKIVVVSWGKMMRLKSVDNVLIEKYIDTYKNQSPEPLAN